MSNHSDSLSSAAAYVRIHDAAVDAAIHFSNAEVRNNAIRKEKRHLAKLAFSLRDAITYRFDSLLYHHGLIVESHETAQIAITTDHEDGRAILRQVATKQRFLFDDVIFNSIGLFDYLGRFGGLVLFNAREPKLRWDNSTSGANTSRLARRGRAIRFTALAHRLWSSRRTNNGFGNLPI